MLKSTHQRSAGLLRTTTLLAALGWCATLASTPAEAKQRVHIVSDEAPTLCEVGIYLYGRCSMFAKIAEWNDLKAPFKVRPGQRLVLKRAPTLSAKKGRARLLSIWRKKFGLTGPAPTALAKPAPLRRIETGPTPVILPPPPPPPPPAAWKRVTEIKLAAPVASPTDGGTAAAAAPALTTLSETEDVVIQPTRLQTPPVVPAVNEQTPAAAEPSKSAEEDSASQTETAPASAPEPPKDIPIVVPAKTIALQDTAELFDEGQKLLTAKEYEKALPIFKQCRERNPKFIPPWISELRSLDALQRADEARTLARELVTVHPQLGLMPLVKKALQEGGR